jgi:hypothetical protein
MHRSEILKTADGLINGERQDHYGPPEDSFRRIGDLWTAYLDKEVVITPVDAANMMALMKIARLANGPHLDSFVDACGYLALAGEMGTDG